MKITNRSPYDKRTMTRVFKAVYRAFNKSVGLEPAGGRTWWNRLAVDARVGRTPGGPVRGRWDLRAYTMDLIVPKLTGDEFIPLVRDGRGKVRAGLATRDLALLVQQMYYHMDGRSRRKWLKERVVGGDDTLKGLPEFVPLRIIKPKEDGPRDVVAERHERVTALLEKWQRKLKLAQTKVKKLKAKKKHYEKKLAQRRTE